MAAARGRAIREALPVRITNPNGSSPFVIICEHASNFVPETFGNLGLDAAEFGRHIAYDPGALPVAAFIARQLDAALVESCVSRLVIDCNRPLDAPDLIAKVSETTIIPGNHGLDAEARARRIAASWTPFHDALGGHVAGRLAAGRPAALVTIHSFTPVWKGNQRPWHVGILHDEDERLSAPLIIELAQDPSITVGDNEPYAPKDLVYFTLEKHARPFGLPCVMIEIRNDIIADEESQRQWGRRLAALLEGLSASGAAMSRQGADHHA